MTKGWPNQPPQVVAVKPLKAYRLELSFGDGTVGIADLRDLVTGAGGVFEPLADPSFFTQVRLSSGGGTIEWPNGVDLCPDVLYSRVTGLPIPFATAEEPAPTKV